MTKKTAQFPHDTCVALHSASQYANCLFYAFGPLQFLWFLWWAEEVPYLGCNDNSLQNKWSSFCLIRCSQEEKPGSKSQSNHTVQILYANSVCKLRTPLNNLAGGHWSSQTPDFSTIPTIWTIEFGEMWIK